MIPFKLHPDLLNPMSRSKMVFIHVVSTNLFNMDFRFRFLICVIFLKLYPVFCLWLFSFFLFIYLFIYLFKKLFDVDIYNSQKLIQIDKTKEHDKIKRTKLKKHATAEIYMPNTKRERHTRKDNNNDINIKAPTCL